MRPLARRALLLLVAGARACRFMIYVGEQPVDGREFLLDTENNLLSLATEPPLVPAAKLSPRFNATQFALRNAELNLDGYGVSWYEAGEPFPRRVRSAAPVVDHGEPDATLAALLRGDAVPTLFRASMDSCVEEPLAPPKVDLRSRAIFAHVRAASPFAEISEKTSHPFAFQTLAWLHNGAVHGFERIRDDLLEATRPAARSLVAGSTDSEIAGAVFADHLAGFPERRTYDLLSLRSAMAATIATISHVAAAADLGPACDASERPSSLNFAATDGVSLVVARYRSHPDEDPPTLYYRAVERGVYVASEPTSSKTEDLREWVLLGKNRMLSYSPASGVLVECVDHGDCDDDVPASTALAYAESWGLIAAIGRPLREKLTEKLAKLREAPPAKDGDAAASAPPPGLPPLLVFLATAAAAVAGVVAIARPATSPPPAPRRARRERPA